MFELSRIFIVLNMWTFQFFCRPNAGNIRFWIKIFRKAFRELQSNSADFERWRHALVMISCSNCFVISLHLFLIKNKKNSYDQLILRLILPKKIFVYLFKAWNHRLIYGTALNHDFAIQDIHLFSSVSLQKICWQIVELHQGISCKKVFASTCKYSAVNTMYPKHSFLFR